MRSAFLIIVAMLFATAPLAAADEEWIGRKVYFKEGAEMFLLGEKCDMELPFIGTVLDVGEEDWLFFPGWVRQSQVIHGTCEAIDYITRRIETEPTAERYIYRGMIWDEVRDHENAIADYTEAIRLDAANALAHFYRGSAWARCDEFDKAIADYTATIQIDPEHTQAYRYRAAAWAHTGESEKALADYAVAIRLDPKTFRVRLDRGDNALLKGNYDAALADYLEAAKIKPNSADAHEKCGNAWAAKGEDDKALASYTEALRCDPKFTLVYKNRGSVWAHKREFDRAIADFEKAIEIDPKDARAYSGRGLARESKGNLDLALADYNKAIGLDRTDPIPWERRGGVRMKKGDAEQALADYEEAIKLEPTAESYHKIAWIRATCRDSKYRNGKVALEMAVKACELSGWHDMRYFTTLATAYAATGDFASACIYQEQVVAACKDGETKQKCIALLEDFRAKRTYPVDPVPDSVRKAERPWPAADRSGSDAPRRTSSKFIPIY